MKIMNKLILTTSMLTVTALNALTYEYPSLYKDPRVMAMGGANVAVGGEAHALFSNPAGLSNMKYYEGFEIDLLNLNFAFSSNTLSLLEDMGSASDTSAMLSVFETYQGSNNNLTINDFSSVSYRGRSLAWSVGVLPSAQFNFQTHALGSSSGLLDINAYVLAGLVAGVSYDLNSDMHLGFGMKKLQGMSMSASLTLSQVLALTDSTTDTTTYLMDNYMSDFSTMTYDAGLIYDLDELLPFGDFLQPSIGLSVLDIGTTDLGKYGVIPMTINVGMSLRPDLPLLSDWLFAVDYIDVTNAYDENYDAAMGKKIRLGARASLFNNSLIKLAGSTGLYNSALTYGLEARLSFLAISYSSFVEEIGAYAGQEPDRRHNLSISMGW